MSSDPITLALSLAAIGMSLGSIVWSIAIDRRELARRKSEEIASRVSADAAKLRRGNRVGA